MFGEHRQLAMTHDEIHHDEFSVWHLTLGCQEFTMIVHAEFETSYGGRRGAGGWTVHPCSTSPLPGMRSCADRPVGLGMTPAPLASLASEAVVGQAVSRSAHCATVVRAPVRRLGGE